MKKILYLYIATLLLAVPSVVAQVDGALTRSGEVGAYDGTRADFLTVAGKLSRYPRLSKAGEALHYAPIVTTDSVPQVAGTHDAVTAYGNILFNGWYDALTEQGFQICTSPDFSGSTLASYPVTPVNAYVECDQPCTANRFSTVISGLTPGVVYYVRAYASNAFGTTYADSLVFMLESGEGCPGSPIAIDHEGNEYKTVQIGYQCWTRQNMRCTTLPSGNTPTLGYVPSQGASGAANSNYQPYYYDCSVKDTILYRGYLYNWAAAMDTVFTANTPDSYVKRRGICPAGWHVPSIEEWNYMLNYVMAHGNTDNYGCDGDSTKITKALSYDTTSWASSTSSCAPGNDPSTNNLTEFSAYPANYYAGSGVNVLHVSSPEYVRFWTSSTYNSNNSSALYIGWDYYESQVRNGYNAKSGGFSVRCVRDVTGLNVPTVSISSVDSVTQETAKVVSEVTNMGGANEIYERGICWSLDTLPTIDNYKLVDETGEGLGEFISRIQYLTPGATYHVRAYAINFEGIGYSADSTITMEAPANRCPGTPTVTDHEGNVYNTVQVGYQCWTRENMRCTTFPDGTEIGFGGDRNGNYIRCYDTIALYYGDNVSTVPLEQSGYLYNWYAVMDTVSKTASIPYVSFEKRRGICPEGWHVPSMTEWDTLVNYMSRQSEYMCRVSGSSKYFANALASKHWWANPNYSDSCYVGVNPEKNNASGMSMIPTGYWGTGSMSMSNRSQYAYFWSSTLYSNSSSYNYGFRLRYDVNRVSSRSDYGDQFSRGSAFPVRCLRDTTGLYVPTVSATLDTVTSSTATISASVTKDGGVAVTERGVCYSTNPNPTVNNSIVEAGAGLGNFTTTIPGLVPNITYYLRAYAKNYEGVGYSEELTFITPANADACTGMPRVQDHEGNYYNTVQIGNQCWMRENMRCKTSPKNPSEKIGAGYSFTYSSSKPQMFTASGADSVRLFANGYLYNWPATIDTATDQNLKASFENRRGICPEGWHVPSCTDWDSLIAYVSSQEDYRCNNNSNNIARALADQGSWTQNSTTCCPGQDVSQNNTTGFSATAVGYINRNTSYSTYMEYKSSGNNTGFWTTNTRASSSDGSSAHICIIKYNSASLQYGINESVSKWQGYSVRCIKNAPGAVEKTNPKVVTNEVSEITGSSAKFNGEVVSDGNVAETQRGFCWDLNANPDTNDYHVVCGTGTGAFNTVISSLQPGNTYYVRAYAVNNMGLVYGEQVTFTTSSDFHVDTIPYVTDFSDDEAWLLTGSDNCWWMIGTNNGYYNEKSLFVTKNGTTAGHYANSYTTVYLSAEKFLKMPAGDSVHVEFDALVGGSGSNCFMKTLLVPANTNVSSNTTYYGSNYSTNAANFAQYYGDVNHYYLSEAKVMVHVSVNMPNPAPNDTCKLALLWAKTYSSGNYNADQYQPGAIITNLVVSPIVVKTESVSEITYAKATVTGSVKVSSEQATIVERGFCWSTTKNPTISGSHVAAGSGAGNFTANVTGLDAQTTYYVSAYATDQNGMTVYGAPVAFQTTFDNRNAHALPYETSFEDAESWYLNNGDQVNYWAIDVIDGDSSLFVSDDGTVHYNNSSSLVIMAERYLAMPQTDSVTVAFDVKAFNGESSYDFLKVFLVPANQEFETQVDQNSYSDKDYSTMALQYNGLYYISGIDASHISTSMLNPTPGDTAKLVFLWRQDSNGGNQPPACITSASVKVSGEGVKTGAVSNVTSNHATVGGYLFPATAAGFTECGICYATTENPTPDNAKVTVSSGFTGGDFNMELNNIESSTFFYARAYVVTNGDTLYGNTVTFITPATFPYTTDFSDHQNSWVNNSGDLGDYWTTGTVNGKPAMFVTDNGTTPHYSSKATVMMEKTIEMPSLDSVNITFDVYAGGESVWDYLKVFLVTEDTEFTPGSYSTNQTAVPYGYGYGVNAMDFSGYASKTTNSSYISANKYMINLLTDTVHVSEMMANPAKNSKAKLVFLWTSDGANTQPGAIIQNLSVSSAGIHTVSVTDNVTTTAVFHGRLDNPNNTPVSACGVCYSSSSTLPSLTDSHAQATAGTIAGNYSVTISDLTSGTKYYARAYMIENGVTVYDTVIFFYTASSTPYQTDFNDGASWFLNNGNLTNKWMVGDYESGKALFISSDNATPGYANSGNEVVMAERILAMPAADSVTVAFDVKVGGESTWDYLKVFLVPSDMVFSPKSSIGDRQSEIPNGYSYGVNALNFSAYLSQTGNSSYPYKLNLTNGNTLRISEKMKNPVQNGSAKIVFLWTNDGSSSTQPGAIITNLTVAAEGSGPDFSCGTSKVADRDGNVYATVQIGEQCWMKENLRVTKYSDGTAISDLRSPNDNSANVPVYGYLYTWDAMMNGAEGSSTNPSGVKGVCPIGWHAPSYGEFNQLSTAAAALDDCSGPARALAANEGWTVNGDNSCSVGYNQSVNNNVTGFTARPAGYYSTTYQFLEFNLVASFLTTNPGGYNDLVSYWMIRSSASASTSLTMSKQGAGSVRCLKD